MLVCPNGFAPPTCCRSGAESVAGCSWSPPRATNCAPASHVLDAAGNPALMTTELKVTVAEHAARNYRVMMNIADELLDAAAERDLPQLDEKPAPIGWNIGPITT